MREGMVGGRTKMEDGGNSRTQIQKRWGGVENVRDEEKGMAI